MKTKIRTLMTLGVVSLLLLPPAFAQEEAKVQQREAMAKLREQAKPGPQHKMLAKFVGKWEVSVSSGKGGGRHSMGHATSYMMLENRFLWLAVC